MPKRKKILLTTSRRPTNRIRRFLRDFAFCLPNIIRVNRGKLNLDGIIEKALEINANRVAIVDRWKGGPGKIQLFLVKEASLAPVNPIIYIRGIKLRREFKIETKPIQSFVITTASEGSSYIEQIAESLAIFFDIPVLSIEQAVSGYSASMYISTTLSQTMITFVLLPEFTEIGPRISIAKITSF